jgi:hypothetical protein
MSTTRSTAATRKRRPRPAKPEPDPQPAAVLTADYEHREAWKLMMYATPDGTGREVVWNARDGEAPMVITLRDGREATHVCWADDTRVPEDWDNPGQVRVFTAMTPERARARAERAVAWWFAGTITAPHLRVRFGGGRDEAAEAMAAALLETGMPDLAEPGDGWRP